MKSITTFIPLDQVSENIETIRQWFNESVISTQSVLDNIETQNILTLAQGMAQECIASIKYHRDIEEENIFKNDKDFKKLTGNVARDYKSSILREYNNALLLIEGYLKSLSNRSESARSANTALGIESKRL